MNKSKRNLFKTIGTSGALAMAWQTPIVSSISLPAHASTTCLNVEIPSDVQVNVPDAFGEDLSFWFCTPGTYLNDFGDALVFYIESGVTLVSDGGFQGTFYVKSGATLNFTGAAFRHDIFFEPGAIITGLDDEENEPTYIETCIQFDTSNAPSCT